MATGAHLKIGFATINQFTERVVFIESCEIMRHMGTLNPGSSSGLRTKGG